MNDTPFIRTETAIVSNLINNKEFFNKFYEFLPDNYMHFNSEEIIVILEHICKINDAHSIRANYHDLSISLENDPQLGEKQLKKCLILLDDIAENPIEVNNEQFLPASLQYIKDQKTLVLLQKGADIIAGVDKKLSMEKVQEEMKQIINMSYEDDLGIFDDDYDRFDLYATSKTPTGLLWLDKFIGGGFPNKTLTCCYAMPHAGKTQIKLQIVASAIHAGFNVCLISGEMTEVMCFHRIDSILLQMESHKIHPSRMTMDKYCELMDKCKSMRKGRLNVKEFASGTASANKVESHLEKIKSKKGFFTDMLVVDSINLMRPIDSKISASQTDIFMEYIVKEYRALAFKWNFPIVTSLHLNREAEKEIKDGADIAAFHASKFYQMYGYADFIFGLRSMYIKDDVVYKDTHHCGALPDIFQIDYTLYDKIVKLNCLKTRFGYPSKVGNSIYLGSNQSKSSFYPIIRSSIEGHVIDISGLSEWEVENNKLDDRNFENYKKNVSEAEPPEVEKVNTDTENTENYNDTPTIPNRRRRLTL